MQRLRLKLLLLHLLSSLAIVDGTSGNFMLPVPTGATALNSTKGFEMLLQATTNKTAYMFNSQHLTTQANTTFCSIATAATILNALSFEVPIEAADASYAPYAYWTQRSYLSMPCVNSQCGGGPHGCTLAQAASSISCVKGLSTFLVYGNETNLAGFREGVKNALGTPGVQVAVNFLRSAVGQAGGGHFSVLGAFEPIADMMLIMDVARYKYPPTWVHTKDLFASVSSFDKSANNYRGFYYAYPNGLVPEFSKLFL